MTAAIADQTVLARQLRPLRTKYRHQLRTALSAVANGATVEDATDAPMPLAVGANDRATFISLLREELAKQSNSSFASNEGSIDAKTGK